MGRIPFTKQAVFVYRVDRSCEWPEKNLTANIFDSIDGAYKFSTRLRSWHFLCTKLYCDYVTRSYEPHCPVFKYISHEMYLMKFLKYDDLAALI